jgi:hypothetical protein
MLQRATCYLIALLEQAGAVVEHQESGRVSPPRQTPLSHHAFFEYRATMTNLTHDESEGESVHCMIAITSADKDGKCLRKLELEQQARDNVHFVLNPGPHREGKSLKHFGHQRRSVPKSRDSAGAPSSPAALAACSQGRAAAKSWSEPRRK